MSASQNYILALDQGTTTSRSILFNRSGAVIALSQKPFTQIYPQGGWVEHDPEEIWQTQYQSALEAIQQAQITPDQIAAIGITNQRETTLLWERATGKPVYNAIVWQCRRSVEICRELKALGYTDLVREKTGLVLDPYFSATKLMWLFQEFPALKNRAEKGELCFGTVDSWLLFKLTGSHQTDVTNASRTLMFNIKTLEWDTELLKVYGIPQAMLPEVKPSSGIFAHTKPALFGASIPVTGCAGDQQAALFGHACFTPGSVKNTYGTGCFTLLNTGEEPVASKNNLLTTIAWQIEGKTTYALEGSVFIAGAVIQWLRDELQIIQNAAESEQLAKSVDSSGGVFIVPAFVGMGAPYWDPDVRGTIVGLTRGSNRAHLVRAALESIALQSQDLFEAMERDFGKEILELKADGGAAANSFLMQYQSDILGKAVILPEVMEITALGAAYLAGLAVHYWKDLRDIEANWRMRRRFQPAMGAELRQHVVTQWHRAIEAARSYSTL
ncbi:MAG: glycerol kinase GlpK [Termitinemataceae bacterium]